MEATAKAKEKLVNVTLVVKQGDEVTTETKQVAKGKTDVSVLKEELGVSAEDSLWVVRPNGKLKQLGDHEEHQVKEGDRYEVIARGGVS